MRRCLAILFVTFALAALPHGGGCGRGDAGTNIVAVGSQWYGHAPVWVGIEKGIFAKHGFTVEWRTIGKSQDRLLAITSGNAQFASLGQIAMLSAMSRGNKAFYWVGNQDIAPGFEGLVARPGIEGWDDLRGKKIGFPFSSSVDLTCRILLKEHGLDPNKDVRLVNLDVGSVPAAFTNGNVDAALIWEPGFSKLKEVEGARVLGMDTDTVIYKRFGTMTGPDVLILSKPWVDRDRDRARRFLAAYFEAVAWVRDNPGGTAKLIRGTYVDQKLEILERDLGKFVWHDLAAQQKVMSDEGIFGQTEFVIDMFLNEIKGDTLAKNPAFREWVPLDLLKE